MGKSSAAPTKAQLRERITYLEQANLWYLSALELATSMVHLHGRRSYTRDPGKLLEDAQLFLNRLPVEFRLAAFFTVDEADSDFLLTHCRPGEEEPLARRLMDQLVESGEFAWALNQNRTVITRLEEPEGHPVLLHVLATKARVRGMFMAILEQAGEELFETAANLISIICHNTAYTLESAALYQLLDDLNQNLELRVRQSIFRIQEQNRQLEEQIAELRDSRGRIEAINSQLRDELFQHARTTRRLSASEERFRSLTQATNDAIVACDERGVITFWNRGAEGVFGYSETEALGLPVTALMPGRFRDAHRQAMARQLATGPGPWVGRRLELHALRRDGGEFPVELSLGQWSSEGHRHFAAVIRDVSDRQAVESRRQQEQLVRQTIGNLLRIVLRPAPLTEQLEQVLDHLLSVPWIDLQPQAVILLLEPGGRHLTLGAQRGLDLRGTPCAQLPVGECLCGLAARERRIVCADGRDPRHTIPQTHLGAHGHYCVPILSQGRVLGVLNLHLAPDHHSQPHEEEFLWAVADTLAELIERNRMDETLRRAKEAADAANRAKGEFLAAVSHDIRTPLHTILGMGELLSDSPLEEQQQRYVRASRLAGEALLSLINDVLDLSKVEANQLSLDAIPFDLRELVTSSLEILQWQAREKGLTLASRWDPALPLRVVGDPTRLRQILLNLLGNAVKFTTDGEVVLEVRDQSGERVAFIVRDTGQGIPNERLREIFQPFVQLTGSGGRRGPGTGLGLAICRRLVALMGGEIWVESTLGRGSAFHFTARLPVAPASRGEHPEAAVGEGGGVTPVAGETPLRILLAEDNPDGRILLRAFLARTPHRVTEVEDGQQAVEAFAPGAFDLILMDMEMPVLDGYAATRRIREREREAGAEPVPIVALTAHAMRQEANNTLAAGCNFHLTKPINREVLLEAIYRFAHP